MTTKVIILVSNEGAEFKVDLTAANKSITIKEMLECLTVEQNGEIDDEERIPLPNVNTKILKKVIDYLNYYKDVKEPKTTDEDSEEESLEEIKIPEWDAEFLMVEEEMLFDLILAANYLNVKGLMESACKTVAMMIRGKTAEEVRQRFHIKNDLVENKENEVAPQV